MEAAHVRDTLAFLRLGENPRDLMAGTRVLGLLPGIGPRSTRSLLDPVVASGSFESWRSARPPPAALAWWCPLLALCEELAAPNPPPLATQLHRIRAFYAPLCEERYDHAEARLRDLESLERLAGGFRDRATFLGDLTLDPPQSTQELAGPPSLDEDYLVLSTIHSAKGLEFDAVYLLHAADGNIPSDLSTGTPAEIDEELRLLYVALSRARTHLTVSFPLRWYDRPAGVGARHSFAQPSRFLTPEVTGCFDSREAVPDVARPSLPPSEEFLPESLRKSLQGFWN